jgi:hypothetical protein
MRGFYSIDNEVFTSEKDRDIRNKSICDFERAGLNNSSYWKVSFIPCWESGEYTSFKYIRMFNCAHFGDEFIKTYLFMIYSRKPHFIKFKNENWALDCKVEKIDEQIFKGTKNKQTETLKEIGGQIQMRQIILRSIPHEG